MKTRSYCEATARQRIDGIVDSGSFRELLPPSERVVSPHLPGLDLPVAFDDGAIVGRGALQGKAVLVAAQEGRFMGGAVGEVHGAKIAGVLARALREHPAAVLLLADTGGVRLHEANVGLVAVSEVIRAILSARSAGVCVVAAIGGACGCFGGMGIAIGCCDAIVMSEEGRLGVSGPEVIEATFGVEEFDARDRALVWRTVGGKHRYLLGDVAALVDDDLAAFRGALVAAIEAPQPLTLESLEAEHLHLDARLRALAHCGDARDVWRTLGWSDPDSVPMAPTELFLSQARAMRAA